MNYVEDLERVSRRIFPFYLFVLFWIPIPLGSNRPLAWGGIALVVFMLLIIYLWNYARANLRPPEISRNMVIVIGLLMLWLFFQIAQLIPLPIEIAKILSPTMVEIKTSSSVENLKFVSLSMDLTSSLHEVIKNSMYISMFILTLLLVNSRDRIRALLLTIVFIGVAQSVWGLMMGFIEQNQIRGMDNPEYVSQITGTFVNRNHFAAFLNISIAAIIGLALGSGIREKRNIHRESYKHYWQSRILDWRIYLVPYFTLLVITLVFTQSRGAITSFFAMMFISILALVAMKISVKSLYENYKLLIWLIAFMLLVFIAEMLSTRLVNLDSDIDSRMSIWATSIHIAKDFWLAGVGSGNFQFIYPVYDSGLIAARVEHAHNDYLELLVEQGIIGVGMLTLIVSVCIRNIIIQIRRSKNLRRSAYSIAALAGIVSFIFHSTVDFSYHIPANAVYFFVFLGVAMLQGTERANYERREATWDEEIFNGSMNESSSK